MRQRTAQYSAGKPAGSKRVSPDCPHGILRVLNQIWNKTGTPWKTVSCK
jgi:hypothetical protein